MRMARMLGGYALVLMAGAVLAGCSFLRNDAEPDRIYALYPASGVAVGAALPGVLQVPRPGVQPGLDTDRIALTRAGNELDFYAQSRWSGPLSQVLGALAVQSMDGAFTTVTDSGRGAGAIGQCPGGALPQYAPARPPPPHGHRAGHGGADPARL